MKDCILFKTTWQPRALNGNVACEFREKAKGFGSMETGIGFEGRPMYKVVLFVPLPPRKKMAPPPMYSTKSGD